MTWWSNEKKQAKRNRQTKHQWREEKTIFFFLFICVCVGSSVPPEKSKLTQQHTQPKWQTFAHGIHFECSLLFLSKCLFIRIISGCRKSVRAAECVCTEINWKSSIIYHKANKNYAYSGHSSLLSPRGIFVVVIRGLIAIYGHDWYPINDLPQWI